MDLLFPSSSSGHERYNRTWISSTCPSGLPYVLIQLIRQEIKTNPSPSLWTEDRLQSADLHLSVCYLGRGVESRRDIAEAERCAVQPRPVVLVPVAVTTGHHCDHVDVGEEEEEDEELHCDKELLKDCERLGARRS